MKNDYLAIEIELLLLRYGESAIIKALADTQEVSLDHILDKLDAAKAKARNPVTKPKPRKTAVEIAKDVVSGSENEETLLELALRFQNKRFLPALKDVKRFAERNGISDNFTSRDAAVKPLFEKLRLFDRERLDDLLGSSDSAGESQFARLSRQLIEGDGKKNL